MAAVHGSELSVGAFDLATQARHNLAHVTVGHPNHL